jgi:hypothetical protein
VNDRLKTKNFTESLTHCFTIDGKPVKSLFGIHVQCSVLIASTSENFKGLKGLTQFYEEQRPSLPIGEIKPKPGTWIQTAAVSWLKNNETSELQTMGQFKSLLQGDSEDQSVFKRQTSLLESLRNEHTKVHKQD